MNDITIENNNTWNKYETLLNIIIMSVYGIGLAVRGQVRACVDATSFLSIAEGGRLTALASFSQLTVMSNCEGQVPVSFWL